MGRPTSFRALKLALAVTALAAAVTPAGLAHTTPKTQWWTAVKAQAWVQKNTSFQLHGYNYYVSPAYDQASQRPKCVGMGKAAAKRYSHFTCAFYAISLEAVNAKDPEWASIHAQARLHVLAAGKGVLTGVQRLQP